MKKGKILSSFSTHPAVRWPKGISGMALKRMAVEFGMGTDLRGEDYTRAAVRALRDALWHNSLTIADALGFPKEAMIVEVMIGVARPDAVDKAQVAAVLPYGSAKVSVVEGGLDVLKDDGEGRTVMANAAAIVYFDIAEEAGA
jgi:uncharacterized protein (TIGR02058 family)